MLLEDQKSHEEACIKKYSEYARRASDPQLKKLFITHSQHEQQHLNTINQLLQGKIPQQNQQSQSQQGGTQPGSGDGNSQGLEMGMGSGQQSQEQQLQEQHGFLSMENNLYQDTQEALQMDIVKVFGTNLRKYRNELEVSQEKFAEMCGLHRTYISDVERFQRSIALDNVQK